MFLPSVQVADSILLIMRMVAKHRGKHFKLNLYLLLTCRINIEQIEICSMTMVVHILSVNAQFTPNYEVLVRFDKFNSNSKFKNLSLLKRKLACLLQALVAI